MEQNPVPSTASRELSITDAENSRSIVRLVPPAVSQLFQDHIFTHEEFFNLDEKELYKRLRDTNAQPSPTDNRLRLKFWMEYDRVQDRQESQINITNVVAGICSREFFYKNYLKNPYKCAWLLCPPAGYMVKAEEALEFSLEQLRDLLEQPHIGAGGKVDTKLGELKVKIFAMLDARVKGAVVQKNLNLNVSTSNDSVAKAAVASTTDDMRRQLKELERRNRVAANLPLDNEMRVEGESGEKPDIEVERA